LGNLPAPHRFGDPSSSNDVAVESSVHAPQHRLDMDGNSEALAVSCSCPAGVHPNRVEAQGLVEILRSSDAALLVRLV
jgi:hypothetical protein